MIQCSNPLCRAVSTPPVSHCQTCQTPLRYRFLLAVSDGALGFEAGSLVAERYWVWSSNIWLDTQPDAPVVPLETLPQFVMPYLRLSILPQHMSQPFTVLFPEDGAVPAMVMLLDAAPIGSRLTEHGEVEAFLLPPLDGSWADGSALQQLDWLRQMARLWEPLAQEGVAATLLHWHELRVDHALLRLSRLMPDGQSQRPVTLAALAQQWQTLLPQTRPEIKAYVDWLINSLIQQDIPSAAALALELDRAVGHLAQGLSLAVDWVAYTDQGSERPRNEDACYPEGQLHQVELVGHGDRDIPLLLVCDGIGGHEQGNVASQTAIKVLREELQSLADHPDLAPRLVEEKICQALALANDAIADRNNDEHRSSRARMGTTVVLALVHFPYVSIAHLGDSRAYRISDRTCYQITLDDDIASRETRLGYTLYPEALQIPNGGALIQALGISDSAQLYPTVQHLLIDDPAVLLLCSDGLSDYDRVEMLWRQYLSPLVLHPSHLPSTGLQLIQQANHLNGHDNVTVGLLRLTPQASTYAPLPARALRDKAQEVSAPAATPTTTQLVAPGATAPQPKPDRVAPEKARFPWLVLLVGAVLAVFAVGVTSWVYQFRQSRATAMASLTLPLSLVKVQENGLEAMTWATAEAIEVGSFWQAGNATPAQRPQRLELSPNPSTVSAATANVEDLSTAAIQTGASPSLVPTGSMLKVVSRQTAADQTTWVRLQVCSIPSGASLEQVPQETDGAVAMGSETNLSRRLSTPGQFGWAQEHHLYRSSTLIPQPTVSQRGDCTP